MAKQFEDYFSEIQADMVALCLEYASNNADDIYIYCSFEANMYVFNVFFKIENVVVRKHELNKVSPMYDTCLERQEALIDNGLADLELIHDKCQKFNHDMPTEMKLHYNVKENSLKGKYKYELVYSNHETLSPNDIFNQWMKEIKNK